MNSHLKKYKTSLLLVVLLMFIFVGCKDNKEDSEPQNLRTFLVYMAADNSLSSDSYKNIESIIAGAKGHLANGKLLVYQDARNEYPQLIEIYQQGGEVKSKVVKTYEEQNSALPSVLSLVIQDAFGMYQAESRGLMLWSHGTSWLPEDKTLWTRSFGQDGTTEMDMDELKAALPDSFFDFIIFDACLMSSVEVCYQLKDKTKYIVASPVEIFTEGFPYRMIIKDLFSDRSVEQALTAVCQTYYDYYIDQPYCDRGNTCSYLASISLVKTSGLEDLALFCNRIVKNQTINKIQNMDVDGIQVMYHHYFWEDEMLFDFKDYFDQLTTEDQKTEMNSLLSEVVLFEKHTSQSYSSSLDGAFAVTKNCGITSYIPRANTPNLNAWYNNLDWGRVVYGSAD